MEFASTNIDYKTPYSGLRICGEPFHTDKQNIISQYKKKGVEDFLQKEAIHSCGSYFLYDSDGYTTRLITSPGFSGGYIDYLKNKITMSIGQLIDKYERAPDLDPIVLASIIDSNCVKYPRPMRTPFENIKKFKPGTIIEIENGNIIRYNSYLNKALEYNPSFDRAMKNTAEALDGRRVNLLFSGGKDSTALYLALRDEIGKKNINPVFVDRSPVTRDSHQRANSVANNLNFELDYIKFDTGWPPNDKNYLDHVEEMMSHRLFDPININQALYRKCDDIYSISGHNMDAMLVHSMPTVPQFHPLKYKDSLADEYGIQPSHPSFKPIFNIFYYIFNNILPSVYHWRVYANNERFRKAYIMSSALLAKLVCNLGGKYSDDNKNIVEEVRTGIWLSTKKLLPLIDQSHFTDSSDRGLYMGQLTTETPSIISIPSYISKTDINSEINEISELWDKMNLSLASQLNFLRYYNYASNHAEIRSVPSQRSRGNLLVSNWGPFLPVFFREIGFSDIISPKNDVREYIKNMSGQTYEELSISGGRDKEINKVSNQTNHTIKCPIIDRFEYSLDTNKSKIPKLISREPLKKALINEMEEIHLRHINRDASLRSNKDLLLKSHRLINIDVLVRKHSRC